jgi:hypothetical protein
LHFLLTPRITKPQKIVRAATVFAWWWAGTAAAQMRDVEHAAPRESGSPAGLAVGSIPTEIYTSAQCAELPHELITTLQLEPSRALALRRPLTARLLSAGSFQPVENVRTAEAVTLRQVLRK